MIVGIGTDIVENARMAKHVDDEGFLSRVFNKGEREYIMGRARRAEALAAHFAVKEAFFKAIGTGIANGFSFRDVTLGHHENGRPFLTLNEKVRAYVKEHIATQPFIAHISLAHEVHYSVATVILETP